MRTIRQNAEPKLFVNWKQNEKVNAPQNFHYDYIPGDVKNAVKISLLTEQGNICAYTMLRLSIENSHIEHIENRANHSAELSVKYQNMLACYPDNGSKSIGHGAPKKSNRQITPNVDFVSPHSTECEQRFAYDKRGCVNASNKNDAAAHSTIAILNLNHDDLKTLRRRAFHARGLCRLPRRESRRPFKPISWQQAEQLAQNATSFQMGSSLEEFCVALAQVANKYAKREKAKQHGMKE